jgi:AhpD family alkylhydroperoxidase
MSNRPFPYQFAERPFKSLLEIAGYVHKSSLEPTLVEFVNMRVSQINGCAYCLNMHASALLKAGVDQRKLNLLPAWREVAEFTPREKAALAWAEYLTKIADTAFVPDEVYDAAREQFEEAELVDLTWAITAINTWNRFNVAFQTPPEAA